MNSCIVLIKKCNIHGNIKYSEENTIVIENIQFFIIHSLIQYVQTYNSCIIIIQVR